jgi:crotonobetainyl-CoA:carnitine CoA-transferase CaiB-like acyl-CoA transferase
VKEDEREGALDVLTILDLSEGIAGAYAARLFADYGARVVKVERPGRGDTIRSVEPFVGKEPGLETSALFLSLNAGKLSLTLDCETSEGAMVLSRLAEEADGIIEDEPALRRADLGLDVATLLASVPRLVITRVSGSGDALAPETQHLVGLQAFAAMMAGLWAAAESEHGQVIEVDGAAALASLGVAQASAATADLSSLRTAGRVWESEHPVAGALTLAAPAFTLTEAPATEGRAPLLGEHTDYVLGNLLGLDAATIDGLRTGSVI